MALTFPLSLPKFFGTLAVVQASFHLPGAVHHSRTARGQIQRTGFASRLWEGTVTVHPRRHAVAVEYEAKAHLLLEADGSFLVTPLHHRGTGIPNAKVEQIENSREISFSGLPPDFVIPASSFFSIRAGSGGARHMHQTLEAATASATGVTPLVTALCAFEPDEMVGDTVVFADPVIEAIVKPDTLRPYTHLQTQSEGLAFDWIQTYR